MQPLGMTQARDGFGGVSVTPVVIGPVKSREMVHDQFCVFQDIRQANREIQAKMRGVVAEIDKHEIDILHLQMLRHQERIPWYPDDTVWCLDFVSAAILRLEVAFKVSIEELVRMKRWGQRNLKIPYAKGCSQCMDEALFLR